tara:strand:- start:29 stop:238 length:210 start_codon:yes stop_codon:yes gene_type:complete
MRDGDEDVDSGCTVDETDDDCWLDICFLFMSDGDEDMLVVLLHLRIVLIFSSFEIFQLQANGILPSGVL